MSRRTVEASKAIRLAWEREQELVREGKGTRDWSKEQQKDILDPDKGKAYDENGRAFEGQHMKSVAEYPEYQGNPDNIQFLTRDEHFDAHKGNWQNTTNWYYDPIAKEYIDFGDEEIILCKIVQLNTPIVVFKSVESKGEVVKESPAKNEFSDIGICTSKNSTDNAPLKVKLQSDSVRKKTDMVLHIDKKMPKTRGFVSGFKKVGIFIVEHPVESLEIAGVVVAGVAKFISTYRGSNNINESNSNTSASAKTNIGVTIADIIERANRDSLRANDVPAHKQRYHTKNGVVWRDKAPYHRGGNKDS